MSRSDELFARLDRDFASLRINYFEMHGEPMPHRLQTEVIAIQHEREST